MINNFRLTANETYIAPEHIECAQDFAASDDFLSGRSEEYRANFVKIAANALNTVDVRLSVGPAHYEQYAYQELPDDDGVEKTCFVLGVNRGAKKCLWLLCWDSEIIKEMLASVPKS